jgi:hypothetical protein
MPSRVRATAALSGRADGARRSLWTVVATAEVAGAVSATLATAAWVPVTRVGSAELLRATAAWDPVARMGSAEPLRATATSFDARRDASPELKRGEPSFALGRVGSAGLKRGASGELVRAPFPLFGLTRALVGEVARGGGALPRGGAVGELLRAVGAELARGAVGELGRCVEPELARGAGGELGRCVPFVRAREVSGELTREVAAELLRCAVPVELGRGLAVTTELALGPGLTVGCSPVADIGRGLRAGFFRFFFLNRFRTLSKRLTRVRRRDLDRRERRDLAFSRPYSETMITEEKANRRAPAVDDVVALS